MPWVWGKKKYFNIYTTILICEYITTHSYQYLVRKLKKDSVSNSFELIESENEFLIAFDWFNKKNNLFANLTTWSQCIFLMVFVLLLRILPFNVSSYLVQIINSQLNTWVQETQTYLETSLNAYTFNLYWFKIKNENVCLLTRGTALSWISKFVSSSSPYCIW